MPRLYLTNESYPELRNVDSRWGQAVTWWQAILHAMGHADFWIFIATQTAIALVLLLGANEVERFVDFSGAGERVMKWSVAVVWITLFAYLQVSWGGDMMRPHLRAVCDAARYGCPCCGQNLRGHLDEGAGAIRCPECATRVDRAIFRHPYRIPAEFHAFPPWR